MNPAGILLFFCYFWNAETGNLLGALRASSSVFWIESAFIAVLALACGWLLRVARRDDHFRVINGTPAGARLFDVAKKKPRRSGLKGESTSRRWFEASSRLPSPSRQASLLFRLSMN